MTTPVAVNQHYLDRVVALSETTEVEASEDILSGNGMKLLAKGARIDAKVKDRLLEHKLIKPLETMMRVVDGVGSRKIDTVADTLLEKHPLLLRVCGKVSARQLSNAMRELRFTQQLDSLLSVYSGQAAHKLEHAVGVSLLSAAMMEDMPQGGIGATQTMMIAGLVHDVGELYIDPAFLQPGQRLTPQQWKHIATHPIVGSHVLKDMPGAGPKVAQIVLHHHERLDGFGYPLGLRTDGLPIGGQVLAMAEMLMGLMESGANHAERATIAVKLIPGEFNRALLDRIASAARQPSSSPADIAAAPAVETAPAQAPPANDAADLVSRIGTVVATVQKFSQIPQLILGELPSASPELKALLTHAVERCNRIGLAFSSTGLDTHSPEEFLAQLQAMDHDIQLEVAIVLREVQWRMGELAREVSLRAERFSAAEAECVRKYVDMAKVTPNAKAAPPAAESVQEKANAA
jgi:hypothetical protein